MGGSEHEWGNIQHAMPPAFSSYDINETMSKQRPGQPGAPDCQPQTLPNQVYRATATGFIRIVRKAWPHLPCFMLFFHATHQLKAVQHSLQLLLGCALRLGAKLVCLRTLGQPLPVRLAAPQQSSTDGRHLDKAREGERDGGASWNAPCIQL